ncbi:MAG: hypothetical protein AB7D29_05255 [Campylobacterales bacterium]
MIKNVFVLILKLFILKTLKPKNRFTVKIVTPNTNMHNLLKSTISFTASKQLIIKPFVDNSALGQDDDIEAVENEKNAQIMTVLLKIASQEKVYCRTDSGFDILPTTLLILDTVAKAQAALEALKNLDKNNIGFYEENKSGKISELTASINGKIIELKYNIKHSKDDTQKEAYKKELWFLKLKRFASSHKKEHPFINFLILIASLVDINKFGDTSKDEQEIVEELMKFLNVGYCTDGQLLRSVAICIEELLKNTHFTAKEIQEIVNSILQYAFDMDDKEIKFIGQRNYYLKNMVNGFPIFDSKDDKFHKNNRHLTMYMRHFLIQRHGSIWGKYFVFPMVGRIMHNLVVYYFILLQVKLIGVKK